MALAGRCIGYGHRTINIAEHVHTRGDKLAADSVKENLSDFGNMIHSLQGRC